MNTGTKVYESVLKLSYNLGLLAPFVMAATPLNPNFCPISEYVKTETGMKVSVSYDSIYSEEGEVPVPYNLREFMFKFDAGWRERLGDATSF